MRRNHILSIVSATFLGALVFSAAASAQATRTWVSGGGDDANPCSRTAPCKTFAGAISKTQAGGEISVLDPGGFGAVTITKSISIVNEGVGEAGVLVSGTNGIVVTAGPNDVVNLRGLFVLGLGGALNGILFNSGAQLHVQNCVIRGFDFGIEFKPNASAQLLVSDTLLNDNLATPSGGGILVQTVSAGSAPLLISLNRVTIEANGFGIKFDGTSGTGQINGTMRDSVIAGNTGNGIWATTPANASTIRLMIDRTASVNNNGTGILMDGAPTTPLASALLNNSIVSGNNTGVSLINGATLLSYKNNSINFNRITDGAPSSTLPAE